MRPADGTRYVEWWSAMSQVSFSVRYTAALAECGGAVRSRPVCSVGSPTTSADTAAALRPHAGGCWPLEGAAVSAEEQAFLQIGASAEAWLIKAAARGAQRLRRKMAEAVDLAKLHGDADVDRAPGTCADAGRFADGDLAAILGLMPVGMMWLWITMPLAKGSSGSARAGPSTAKTPSRSPMRRLAASLRPVIPTDWR
ncbi:MAG: hypothetical protein JO325_05005 [Solirubrobacterales bacterium]|nr:hypothetical protein [Solirubrobacterales bacterium]